LDGSFTVTLFLSYETGEYNFENLTTPEIVTEFFQKEFPDALELMPNLVNEFFENPTAPLGTVKCFPWHYKKNSLLLGDSAHAIVPFYGQGMNASFEDVVEFDRFLDLHDGDWEATLKAFGTHRKIDTDAIADLAIDNFHEMKNHVANPLFQEKRKIEMALEAQFPETYYSKYSLVTFKETIGYNEAMTIGRAQDTAILKLLSARKITPNEDLNTVLKKVQQETSTILKENAVPKIV
jgi:kynurenine 3-monooxygenase